MKAIFLTWFFLSILLFSFMTTVLDRLYESLYFRHLSKEKQERIIERIENEVWKPAPNVVDYEQERNHQ
jgi:hypothetical protein